MSINLVGLRTVALLPLLALTASGAWAQEAGSSISHPDDARSHGLESLKTIVESEGVPLPSNLNKYVSDKRAAEQLGKALFHEMAIGSDAVQACVTCHFKAGADPRAKNQLSPGLLRVKGDREGDVIGLFNAKPNPDDDFEVTTYGANYTLQRDDFPLVKEVEENYPIDDVISSQGMIRTAFDGVEPGKVKDISGGVQPDAPFQVGYINTRRVEPRNTPTTINAIFNFFNFWDGRANPRFNGENPFGKQDKIARIFKKTGRKIVANPINLKPASLASQASGPPLSHFEMSWGTDDAPRIFPDIGRKVIPLEPLSLQEVHYQDSLLASLRDGSDGKGLYTTYEKLIQQAFNSAYWDAPNKCIPITAPEMHRGMGNNFGVNNGVVDTYDVENGQCEDTSYTLMESNFAFFFSVAVMLYEATLVSDETPFDNWMRGDGDYVDGFGKDELAGLNVFVGKGKCVNCHGGPELTNASVRNAQGGNNIIEPMLMGDRRPALYDNGFYNIGVTPTKHDRGRGDNDPFGPSPLSSSRQFAFDMLEIAPIRFPIIGSPIRHLVCDPDDSNVDLDPSTCDDGVLGFVDPDSSKFFAVCKDNDGDGMCGEPECEDEEALDAEGNCGEENVDELLLQRVAVDGAFKTPGLRNVAETAPYMHNGSLATLREVVQFYDRGGNFCETNGQDLDPDIQQLGLTDEEEEQLVAFLISLTDQRVVYRAAPFDSPAYLVPNGHIGDNRWVEEDPFNKGAARDDLYSLKVAAVGRYGGPPLESFADLLEANYNPSQFYARPVAGICSPNFPKPPEEEPPVEEPPKEEPPKEEPPAEEPPPPEEEEPKDPNTNKGKGKKK